MLDGRVFRALRAGSETVIMSKKKFSRMCQKRFSSNSCFFLPPWLKFWETIDRSSKRLECPPECGSPFLSEHRVQVYLNDSAVVRQSQENELAPLKVGRNDLLLV